MLKSIGSLSLLVAVVALAFVVFAEDPVKPVATGTCGSGACSQDVDTACDECPSGAACQACAKDGQACSAEKKCGDGGCAQACGKCTSTTACASKACAQDGGACAAGKCSGAECTKNCEGCPSAGTATATTSVAGAGGACASKACGEACSQDCKECPITAAMKALPQMTYAVGESKTNCPKAAAELAKGANSAVHYVVCEKSYDAEADANAALAEATEKFVADFAEPKKCEESGKVTVCGKELCCETMASETASVAKSAMEKITMSYLVGEKECGCPVEAEKLAKDSGNPTVFVVAGESTGCNVMARLNLARAKYKAAVTALMQAEAPAETQETTNSQDS